MSDQFQFTNGQYGVMDPYQAQQILMRVYETLKKAVDPMPSVSAYNVQPMTAQIYHSMHKPFDPRPIIEMLEQYLGIQQPTYNGGPIEDELPRLQILVQDQDDELVFEGTEQHWRDCFFDNATYAEIEAFCIDNDWKYEITRRL